MKTLPWLKYQSDTVGESSISEIEVAERERPAQVGEPDQEDEAEEAPHPRLVDLDAAERALVAARHLPRDLRPGPRLGDDAARVVDVGLDDLARRPEPDLHEPARRLRVVGLVVLRARACRDSG